jgi:hypothetical protein
LTSIHNHALLVYRGNMVLAGTRREARCLALDHPALIGVELEELVGAFADLAFWAEHKAAAKSVDFVVIGD